MNTMEPIVWKELLMKLKTVSQQNTAVLQEIENQVSERRQKQMEEIQKEAQALAFQKEQLESLLQDLEEDQLFSAEEEEKRSVLQDRLLEQLEQTDQLLQAAASLLQPGQNPAVSQAQEPVPQTAQDIPLYTDYAGKKASLVPKETAPGETAPVSEAGVMKRTQRPPKYPASQFKKDVLLGNWICTVKPDQFVCQSFWADGIFREYEFTNGALTAETEGRYLVENGKVFLNRHRQNSILLRVQGFDEDVIDYLIEGQKVRFQYMPEDVLNRYLEQAESVPAMKKSA